MILARCANSLSRATSNEYVGNDAPGLPLQSSLGNRHGTVGEDMTRQRIVGIVIVAVVVAAAYLVLTSMAR